MSWPLIGIFLLVAIAALKIGSTFVLPIVVSVLFTFLLGPPVRWLKKRRIPEAIGAGVLVFGTVIVLCGGMYFLSDPAAEWIERAPKTMSRINSTAENLDPLAWASAAWCTAVQEAFESSTPAHTGHRSKGIPSHSMAFMGLASRGQCRTTPLRSLTVLPQ